MGKTQSHIILCGGAPLPAKHKSTPKSRLLRLTYDKSSKDQNVNLELPHLIAQVNCHFPDRIKDLLEIAGYVYAADRLIKRGDPISVEYQSWSRSLHFFIKVRDYDFWKSRDVSLKLIESLVFVSGDMDFHFSFLKGGRDIGQTNLYDMEGISLEKRSNSTVALFSGGLDSLAGALEILTQSDKNIMLISHRSNNSAITQIQKGLIDRLMKDFPGRIQYFPFYCNLHGERAVEETQRTRIFLYTAIAQALPSLASEEEILVFENGITSVNFYKRQDLMNARASRTTHPKTLQLFEDFYTLIEGNRKRILHPFLYSTKTDILNKIKASGKLDYINSTITCTKTFLTFENNTQATHCGICSQCIDRQFAAFASELEDHDAIYDINISKDVISSPEGKIHLHDYVRLVARLHNLTELSFPSETLDILSELIPYLPGQRNSDKIKIVYHLTKLHTSQVSKAIQRIMLLQDPLKKKRKGTIHTFIDDQQYLKPAVENLVQKIIERMALAIPESYQRQKPANENVLNDLIGALLKAENDDYKREFAGYNFSITRAIPDHLFTQMDLLIEAKYARDGTTKSTITEGIAADITKYPKDKFKLFIVYDPQRKISNDEEFKKDFENNPNCRISIIR